MHLSHSLTYCQNQMRQCVSDPNDPNPNLSPEVTSEPKPAAPSPPPTARTALALPYPCPVQVSCGSHHTAYVDERGNVFTFGLGD